MEKKEVKQNVALVEHPVSLEQKMDLRKEGLVIIDVRQKENVDPDRIKKTIMKPKDVDGDGLQDKDPALEVLRNEAEALGMNGFGRLGIDKLTAAIEAKKAE
jgi:rhodanese-related sulfurtransferase